MAVSIFRDIPIMESVHFQFRAELFNLTNTPHWWLPGSSVSAPGSFGIITSTDAGYLGRGHRPTAIQVGREDQLLAGGLG
jgi:hypothetical protein